jgi:ABC-2 type transport system ATP-binding protein
VVNDSLENLRNQPAEKVLVVAFTSQVEAQQLSAIAGITEVVPHENGSYELWGTSVDEMWRNVTDFSTQKGIGIRSLQAGGTSLEEIFRQLTTG